MRKLTALVASTLLLLTTASAALAAGPEITRDRTSGSEYDWFMSEVCGFDVWLDYRQDFTFITKADGSSVMLVHVERIRTGPGGSIKQLADYTFTSGEDGFTIIGDPESGSFQEVIHEVLHGSRVWVAKGGVVYRDAGYYDATLTITYTPDDVTFALSNEVAHGQQPTGQSEEVGFGLICATIG